ncbi:hypothetical protein NitYY0826_P32 (plasmid) [Nitratiruptor sp. YY08-26]|uniref:hypothetical protein n=1 Tax=unclassified Nitratiruptor TaxID=2624044 RepID=UPI0018ECF58A|nr:MULTISPECIES: hypothetical protein [unclassified Nitratiruptor]BCD63191.1 hypothetical protein NitYY0813_P32 [Nitratiruptor sp. YY08-13]BCD67127.1 hypothetical protein NitYY0826_P32 [Nitratiruptor sp. YY08-26]
MDKKLLYILIIGGIGILTWIFIPSTTTSSNTIQISKIQNSSSSASSIVIETKQSSSFVSSSSKAQIPLYKEKKVKYYIEDKDFKIALIDTNLEDENVTINSGYKKVIGSLDGHRFILKIPIQSLENGNLKLVIIKSGFKEKKELDANFIKELNTLSPQEEYHLKINFDNISNYQTDIQEKQSLLPTPVS